MSDQDKSLMGELLGTQCRCGATKAKRTSFCRKCFYTLPRERRDALYQRVGQGYEQAYEAACEYLNARRSDEIEF